MESKEKQIIKDLLVFLGSKTGSSLKFTIGGPDDLTLSIEDQGKVVQVIKTSFNSVMNLGNVLQKSEVYESHYFKSHNKNFGSCDVRPISFFKQLDQNFDLFIKMSNELGIEVVDGVTPFHTFFDENWIEPPCDKNGVISYPTVDICTNMISLHNSFIYIMHEYNNISWHHNVEFHHIKYMIGINFNNIFERQKYYRILNKLMQKMEENSWAERTAEEIPFAFFSCMGFWFALE